jgi:hypothetical protein
MTTQSHQKSTLSSLRTLFILLACSTHLTGCFVSLDDGYDDDYYEDGYYEDTYYEDDYYDDSYSEDVVVSERVEEHVEEHVEEEVTEEVTEETTTTTTTTTNTAPPAESIVDSQPVDPRPVIYLEERFENPELSGVGHIAISELSQWMIDWTPGSRCENISGTASLEIQSDIDLGDQFEVEGLQHARLDSECGDEINPIRLTTSLADVRGATQLTFYARSAESTPDAELMVEWGDEVVMNEPLLNGWAEYTIDLTRTQRPVDALLTITSLTPGVLIDHIQVK